MPPGRIERPAGDRSGQRSGHRLGPVAPDDTGWSLLEAVFAVVLVGITVAVGGGLAIRSITASTDVDRRTTAILVAGSTLDQVRGLVVQRAGGTVPLLAGRTRAAVSRQWRSSADVRLADTDPAWDPAPAGAPPLVALESTRPIDGVPFAVRVFIGTCVRPVAGGDCGSAAAAAPDADGVTLYRVVAAVTWPGCAADCTVTAQTLIDVSSDPEFNSVTNTRPVAEPDLVCTVTGVPVDFDPLINDLGSLGNAPVTVLTLPSNGTLYWAAGSAAMRWTPPPGFVGTDSFTYRVTDVRGARSGPGTVTLRAGMGSC